MKISEIRKQYPTKTYEDREQTVNKILSHKESMTVIERLVLLFIVIINFHTGGKIAGIYSCDSSAHGCSFCQKMKKAAENICLLICGLCYDYEQEIRRPAVFKGHNLNRIILSSVLFTVDEWKQRPIKLNKDAEDKVLRINSSGDTENAIHAENMLNLSYANPEFDVGYWAKNVPAVEEAIHTVGKPENVRFVQSSLRIGFEDEMSPEADLLFTVYPDVKTCLEAIRKGGKPCNGRKCNECGKKCYKKPENGGWEKGSNVCELLRCSEADRKLIMEAYLKEKARREAIKEKEN